MKESTSSTVTNVYDFLQDVQGFLEQTLATEKLSRLALEQRTRLLTKLPTLIKEYENDHQMEMYINMSPTLKSFFQSSDGSTSDNSSIRDQVPVSEEFYDVPTGALNSEVHRIEDECDAPVIPNSLPPNTESKKLGFMQRLLKNRSKSNESESEVKILNGSNEDKRNCKETRDSFQELIYDDASNVNMPKSEELVYDDAAAISKSSIKNTKITSDPSSSFNQEELYDDASQILVNKETSEDYEYVVNGSLTTKETHNNNNNDDIDAVSVKSGFSSIGANASSHRWHITASEAKTQALRFGGMKRRNGRKLLSAWRNCYSILLPAHLLMYAKEEDSQPRVVIDLSEPNIKVKRLVKQGADSKRLKTHPFVLLHDGRPLYEMSTKSREETDEWIVALQAILIQASDPQDLVPPDKTEDDEVDDEDESVYEFPSENIQQREIQSRMETIQGRNLPSVPALEQRDKMIIQTPNSSDKANNSNKLPTLFRFSRGRSSSSEEEQQPIKRKSVDSSTNTEEVYQELPSPTVSGTPYSSVENLKASNDDIYYNVVEENRQSTGKMSPKIKGPHPSTIQWPVPPPVEDLPVYDIPSPTIRPLSSVSNQSNDGNTPEPSSFANLISQGRKFIFNQQPRKISISGSVTVVSSEPEVYDVPVSSPRPISMAKEAEPEALEAYDRVLMPPRTVIPPPETSPPPPPPSSTGKINRSWKEIVDKPLTNFKKDTSPPTKCLPKPSGETKSVGRNFTRVSPPRTPLASLSELLASSKQGMGLKPSTLKSTLSNTNVTLPKTEVAAETRSGAKPSISAKPRNSPSPDSTSNGNKKEPPPRPPAPARLAVTSQQVSESVNISDELSRKFMQRAMRNREAIEPPNDAAKSKELVGSSCQDANKEQYKARWAYVASNQFELSINSGEIVQVLKKNDANWLVQTRNKKGFVPKEYLVPLTANALSLTKIGEAPIRV